MLLQQQVQVGPGSSRLQAELCCKQLQQQQLASPVLATKPVMTAAAAGVGMMVVTSHLPEIRAGKAAAAAAAAAREEHVNTSQTASMSAGGTWQGMRRSLYNVYCGRCCPASGPVYRWRTMGIRAAQLKTQHRQYLVTATAAATAVTATEVAAPAPAPTPTPTPKAMVCSQWCFL
jgi:hypothetical protein